MTKSKYPHTFYSKVRGVTHTNKDGKSRQDIIKKIVTKGMNLIMVTEPSNPVDPNALALYAKGKLGIFQPDALHQIGYIGHDVAIELHKEMAVGHRIYVDVNEITGGTKDTEYIVGVNIKIKITE